MKYAETISPTEVLEETFIVRKEVAQKMGEVVSVPVREEARLPMIPEKVPEIQKEAIRKITLRANVPWDRLSDIVRGVLTPLSRDGARISLEVKIEAESRQGN